MIGRRCKARERLSRAPLIGRALRDTYKVPSAPDRSQDHLFPKRCAAPRAPWSATRPQQPAPQRPPGAGGHGGRGTPGPIPNPEVKPASADGTAGATLWESRAPPAPGARCAGRGRGGAEEAPGRGGPEGAPSFVCGRFPAFSRRGEAAGPLGGGRPFRVRGRPARIPHADLPCRQRRRRPFDMSRTSSRGNNRPGLTSREPDLAFLYIVARCASR